MIIAEIKIYRDGVLWHEAVAREDLLARFGGPGQTLIDEDRKLRVFGYSFKWDTAHLSIE